MFELFSYCFGAAALPLRRNNKKKRVAKAGIAPKNNLSQILRKNY